MLVALYFYENVFSDMFVVRARYNCSFKVSSGKDRGLKKSFYFAQNRQNFFPFSEDHETLSYNHKLCLN